METVFLVATVNVLFSKCYNVVFVIFQNKKTVSVASSNLSYQKEAVNFLIACCTIIVLDLIIVYVVFLKATSNLKKDEVKKLLLE